MSEADRTLAIDIGNSRFKFGIFEFQNAAPLHPQLPTCEISLALPVHEEIDWGVVTAHFMQSKSRITRAVVAAVNPAALKRLQAGWNHCGWPVPRIVARAAELPLRTNVERPDHVGIDRLLDCVAANLLRAQHQPAIIIDSGTATTVNVVSADGVFMGGAILPGVELQSRSLHEHTALLPLIDVRSLADDPVAAVGRSTPEAIISGLWFGQIGGIRELTSQFTKTLGATPLVLVTGGLGRRLAPALGDQFRFEPDLALRALAFFAQAQEH
jgi:type III pantothenate kinase